MGERRLSYSCSMGRYFKNGLTFGAPLVYNKSMKIRQYLCIGFLSIWVALCSCTVGNKKNISLAGGYATGGNFLIGIFNEPFETIVFIWPTMDYVTFTSQNALYITIPISIMIEVMASKGLDLKYCMAIYHNHSDLSGFSEPDIKSYFYFKNKGFNGLYGIYYPMTNKIRFFKEYNK